MDFDLKSRVLEIVLKNDGTENQRFYDSLSPRHDKYEPDVRNRVPRELGVIISTKDGQILSKNKAYPDGYINQDVLDEVMHPLPVKEMATLPPHQNIFAHVKLEDILAGSEPYFSFKLADLKDYCVKFKVRVALDEMFTKVIEKETPVVCISSDAKN